MTIHAIFKFAKTPKDAVAIDTTSNLGRFRDLSPFILSAPPAKRFENLWQFSKVYEGFTAPDGLPNMKWYEWRRDGFNLDRAVRYPRGKGTKPEYSFWEGKKLGYIEARKQIYAPEYAKNVLLTDSYKILEQIYHNTLASIYHPDLILLDYDAYDHLKLGMTLKDVINNADRKMGHAFILIMMLTGELDECLK